MPTIHKKNVDWHAVETITTPSQTRAYIDSCKEWLLAMPNDDDDTDVTPQEPPTLVAAGEHHNNGLLREGIHECNVFKCFICKDVCSVTKGRVVIANPFTRAQCLLFCSECCPP